MDTIYLLQKKSPRVLVKACDTLEQCLEEQKKYEEKHNVETEIIKENRVPLFPVSYIWEKHNDKY